MSNIIAKALKQLVVGSVTQPLKLGGIAENGSDYKMQIATDGSVSTTTSLAVPSLTVNSKNVMNGLLAEYTVTGSAVTSIDFSGLDINTHKSYRVELELVNATASGAQVFIYINGDTTGTNYYEQHIYISGTMSAPARNNASECTYLDSSKRTQANLIVQRSGSGYCSVIGSSVRDATAATTISTYAVNKTATVTNITQLTFTASVASSIGVGSTIRIYRNDV